MTSPYSPYLDWIDTRQDSMLEQMLAWSRINSGSMNLEGVNTMRHALTEAFSVLEGAAEEFPLSPLQSIDSSGNRIEIPIASALRVIKRPQAKLRVFLCGHMDTVFPADHPFQEPVQLDDNTINGPGVADLKGGLAVMLTALRALEQSPWANNIGWEILLNPDEEIGSPGSAPLLKEAAGRNSLGMIYEPALADGTLAGSRKGSGNYTIVIHGKSAHAGREHHLGRNAIVALSRFIIAVDELNGRKAGITVNPAKLEGGGPNNVVPNKAIGRFNVRVTDATEQAWFETQLEVIRAQIEAADGISVELHGGFGRPAKKLSYANTRLFESLAECGHELDIPVRWQATGGCCDGNNLAAAGLPNIDTLGVRGGAIHSADEFMLIDSLTERAKLSALFLMKLASGELPWPPIEGGASS